jgi:hypothetical protein
MVASFGIHHFLFIHRQIQVLNLTKKGLLLLVDKALEQIE